MIKNFLTFDIEEWYYGNFQTSDLSKFENSSTNLEKNIDKIIEICSKFNIKSTCFIVGKLAKKKPHIVKKLYSHGHEIASHSLSHKLIYNMKPDEFYNDLNESCKILEDITGEKIIGFRAPSWSVNEKVVEWFYDILYENGIKYSSSIYPSKTYLYGIPNFPEKIHFPIIKGKRKKVLEIPQSLINFFGFKVGFSGGFYLRFFPARFIIKNIKNKNRKGANVFLYLHPHELGENLEKTGLGIIENFILKFGIKRCIKKLNKILLEMHSTLIRMDKFYYDFKSK